jgi:uridine kinase
MKLILIDGGPASGKNTLGDLVVKEFNNFKENAVLLDLDTYIEKFNPKWIWTDEKQKEKDQQNARN